MDWEEEPQLSRVCFLSNGFGFSARFKSRRLVRIYEPWKEVSVLLGTLLDKRPKSEPIKIQFLTYFRMDERIISWRPSKVLRLGSGLSINVGHTVNWLSPVLERFERYNTQSYVCPHICWDVTPVPLQPHCNHLWAFMKLWTYKRGCSKFGHVPQASQVEPELQGRKCIPTLFQVVLP